jgi:glycosyltransferase involved in cell wall biosynthesis
MRDGPGALGAIALGEGRRLAAFEASALRRAAATIALTARDARRLAALGARGVRVIAPPFPATLPSGPPLPGAPAVVVFGSAGWFPNRQAATAFVADVWPAVRARLPGAVLHVVGVETRRDDRLGIVPHAPPASSRDAFARDAILVVPSRVASGIRMKILEAWARDVAVVATPAAAEGLDLAGEPLALADRPQAIADAVARLHESPEHAERQRRAGRAALARRHDPPAVAAALAALYDDVRAAGVGGAIQGMRCWAWVALSS